MSILLFCVGAIAFLAGGVMVGFGIPISDFSFGNTLISAGATTAVGGLIVIGLGAVVSKLRQIADTLAGPVRPGRPLDIYESAAGARAAAGPPPNRTPFPPKPKPAPNLSESLPLEPRAIAPVPGEPIEEPAAQSFAPTFAPSLHNPDEPPMTVEEESVSLSPQHPVAAPRPAEFDEPMPPEPPAEPEESSSAETRPEPPLDGGWRAPFPPQARFEPPQARQHSTYFDTMWPAETRAPKAASAAKPEPQPDLPPRQEASAPAPREEPEPSPAVDAPRASVAILKSGVVDGMAYTLYVDGSIEAELPQGTLHFASINELRRHLENNA